MTYRHLDVYRVVMAQHSRMHVAQRFCRHLCEVNCLSDGSTAPIKSIAMRGVKGARKEGYRGWRTERVVVVVVVVVHYGLSCLETHELGKSSFQFDSASSLAPTLSFSLIVREGRFVAVKSAVYPLPFITIRNDEAKALFLDCAAKRCSR